MKKLMIAAAIVCAAAFAQAAIVDWSSGVVYAPGADGNGYKGDYSYIAPDDATGYSAILMVSESYNDGALGEIAYQNTVTEMDASSEAFVGTIADGVLASDGTHYGQIVISDGKGGTLTSDIFAFTTTAMQDNISILIGEGGDGISLASGEDLDEDYGAFGAGWVAGAAPVPEPTSGLLLLLGVAGLALRRRRA